MTHAPGIYIASGSKPETNQKSGPDLIGPLSLVSECLYGSPGTRFTSMVLLVAGAIIASTTNATDARG